MSWDKGRDVIEDLISRGHLEQVPAHEGEAAHLLTTARTHLRTARTVADDDPEIAYDALYGAARKALTALLIHQGLRPTRAGGHEAVIEAAVAQLVPPLGEVLRPYRRLRRRRGQADYAGSEDRVHAEDIEADLPAATAILDAAERVLPQLTVFVTRR